VGASRLRPWEKKKESPRSIRGGKTTLSLTSLEAERNAGYLQHSYFLKQEGNEEGRKILVLKRAERKEGATHCADELQWVGYIIRGAILYLKGGSVNRRREKGRGV